MSQRAKHRNEVQACQRQYQKAMQDVRRRAEAKQPQTLTQADLRSTLQQLARACSASALYELFEGGSAWASPQQATSTTAASRPDRGASPTPSHTPSAKAVESALTVLKIAEIACEEFDGIVPTLEGRYFFEDDSAAEEAATPALFLSRQWPWIITFANTAVAHSYGHRPRRALQYSERAVAVSQACPCAPQNLAQTAARVSAAVAEHIIVLFLSHGTILHTLQRTEEGLAFAKLSCQMCHSYHRFTKDAAIQQAATDSEKFPFSPSYFVGTTCVGTLLSLTQYNTGVMLLKAHKAPQPALAATSEFARRHSEEDTIRTATLLLQSALDLAAAELGPNHGFTQRVRQQAAASVRSLRVYQDRRELEQHGLAVRTWTHGRVRTAPDPHETLHTQLSHRKPLLALNAAHAALKRANQHYYCGGGPRHDASMATAQHSGATDTTTTVLQGPLAAARSRRGHQPQRAHVYRDLSTSFPDDSWVGSLKTL